MAKASPGPRTSGRVKPAAPAPAKKAVGTAKAAAKPLAKAARKAASKPGAKGAPPVTSTAGKAAAPLKPATKTAAGPAKGRPGAQKAGSAKAPLMKADAKVPAMKSDAKIPAMKSDAKIPAMKAAAKAAPARTVAAKGPPAKTVAVKQAVPRRPAVRAPTPTPAARRARTAAAPRKAAIPPKAKKPVAPQVFTVSHLDQDDFKADGLRPYAKYRDLGIAAATAGLARAHVIRFVPPCTDAVRKRHFHSVDLQLVYVLQGWMKNEFEGQGEQMMSAGSCWIQPSGIKHTVLDYSPDCEVLEIILPADFKTEEV